MKSILVACVSRKTAERGFRVAADLSVACGARLSLAYVPEQAVAVSAASGLEAMGHLSSILFAPRDPHSPAPAFVPAGADAWLAVLRDRVEACWETSPEALPHQVRLRSPDLIVTCDGRLARTLVADTTAPVWHVRPKQRERSWFAARMIRCAVRGSRAVDWAAAFASGLGVELQTMRTSLFSGDNADLVVVAREARAPLMRAWTVQPLVVV